MLKMSFFLLNWFELEQLSLCWDSARRVGPVLPRLSPRATGLGRKGEQELVGSDPLLTGNSGPKVL